MRKSGCSETPPLCGDNIFTLRKCSRWWAGHAKLETTLKYLHVNESYEYLEMDKMLETEKANEKIVSLDEYRKAS